MEQLEGYISLESWGQERSLLNANITHFFPLLVCILAFLNVSLIMKHSHGYSWEKFCFFIFEPAVQSSFSEYIINEVC